MSPGKYDRKIKTQRNSREFAQAVDHVVQFDTERGTSPRLEIQVKSLGNQGPRKTLGQVLHGCRQLVM